MTAREERPQEQFRLAADAETTRPHPTEGELAEQRHLIDPLDHILEALAPHSRREA